MVLLLIPATTLFGLAKNPIFTLHLNLAFICSTIYPQFQLNRTIPIKLTIIFYFDTHSNNKKSLQIHLAIHSNKLFHLYIYATAVSLAAITGKTMLH